MAAPPDPSVLDRLAQGGAPARAASMAALDALYEGVTLAELKRLSQAAMDGAEAAGADGVLHLGYGEVADAAMLKIVDTASRALKAFGRPLRTVLDVGSGAGRPSVLAALAVPQLQRSVGVEVIPSLVDVSAAVATAYDECYRSSVAAAPGAAPGGPEVAFRQGDAINGADADYSDFDLVVCNATLFPPPLASRVYANAAQSLTPGATLAILSHAPPEDSDVRSKLADVASLRLRMSWGHADVHILQRRASQESTTL